MNKFAISTMVFSFICLSAFSKGGNPKDFTPECPQKSESRALKCAPWKRWQSSPIQYRVCEFRTVGGASFYVKNTGSRKISFGIDLTFVDGSTDKGGRLTLRPGEEDGFTCPRCRQGEPGLRSVSIYKIRYE
jgi:hypothetical protein